MWQARHLQADCYGSAPKGRGKGKGGKGGKSKGKGKGKDQEPSSKGTGKGKGKENVRCFDCGQFGHIAANCPGKGGQSINQFGYDQNTNPYYPQGLPNSHPMSYASALMQHQQQQPSSFPGQQGVQSHPDTSGGWQVPPAHPGAMMSNTGA